MPKCGYCPMVTPWNWKFILKNYMFDAPINLKSGDTISVTWEVTLVDGIVKQADVSKVWIVPNRGVNE